MIPIYIVAATHKDGSLIKVGMCHGTQASALEWAKEYAVQTAPHNFKTFVFESIAEIELPKPRPIVTMKGD